ncbi:hypothetical protein [Cellulomonas marina]|uniref:hypothetical protein n=1 Tax=Cellulomonas marina TaxID=988821 RepID=UPI001944FD7D|nr:hypothetical protein [Cellulomonas marina]
MRPRTGSTGVARTATAAEPPALTGGIVVVPASPTEPVPSRRVLRALAEAEAATGAQPVVPGPGTPARSPGGPAAAEAPRRVPQQGGRVGARRAVAAAEGGPARVSARVPPTGATRAVPVRRSTRSEAEPRDELVPAWPVDPSDGVLPGAPGQDEAMRPAWAPITGQVPVVDPARSLLPLDVPVPAWPALRPPADEAADPRGGAEGGDPGRAADDGAPAVPAAGTGADRDTVGEASRGTGRPRRRGLPSTWAQVLAWSLVAVVLGVLVGVLVDRARDGGADGAASPQPPTTTTVTTATVTTATVTTTTVTTTTVTTTTAAPAPSSPFLRGAL